eukprot:2408244-Rhodomonas_salina.2
MRNCPSAVIHIRCCSFSPLVSQLMPCTDVAPVTWMHCSVFHMRYPENSGVTTPLFLLALWNIC